MRYHRLLLLLLLLLFALMCSATTQLSVRLTSCSDVPSHRSSTVFVRAGRPVVIEGCSIVNASITIEMRRGARLTLRRWQ